MTNNSETENKNGSLYFDKNCCDRKIPTHEMNNIKHKIAVVSGKGGVGKSLITGLLAVTMNKAGYNVGVLDADITGPSIPKMFGADNCKVIADDVGLYPPETSNGIKIMSINLVVKSPDTAVIWKGPRVSNMVEQFWTETVWGDMDYLLFDMPPGTGDVPLTVFQSIPIDGVIIVTSPQDLVSLIVKKAYNMARTMNIPIIGIIENLSYVKCPDCDKEIHMFGESKTEKVAEEYGIKFLGRLPLDPETAALCDRGEIEKFNKDYVDACVNELKNINKPEV